MLSRTL